MLERASPSESIARKSPLGEGARVENWGLIDYQEALDKQLVLVEKVQKDLSHETIVVCSHPPVVTLGRATEPSDIAGWKGQTYEIQRGGRATYHGPSQLVIYPILDLNSRGRDLHKYIRSLENAIIEMLLQFGLVGRAEQGATGVWVGERKVASIGIGVKRWVTYHGLALNVSFDPQAFRGINPCGFQPETMISMEELVGEKIDFAKVSSMLAAIVSRL